MERFDNSVKSFKTSPFSGKPDQLDLTTYQQSKKRGDSTLCRFPAKKDWLTARGEAKCFDP